MRGVRRGLWAIVLVCAWALPASQAHAQSQSPRARITSGPPAETSETRAAFAFEATSLAPLSGFECRLDGGPWQACQTPHAIEALTGGPHRFEVRLTGPLTDPTPAEWRWTVALQTSVDPPVEPLPPPGAEPPAPPPPPRELKRRDAYGCAYAANRPREVRDARLERATLCAINRLRSRRGLRPLRHDPYLQRAAARHAADMVRRRYFSHHSPEGLSSYDRIRRAGYLRGAEYWTLAEVLAWEHRPGPSPADTVRAWMRSPGHRHALLLASVREIGVAVVHGTPAGNRGGATWAANLGRRG